MSERTRIGYQKPDGSITSTYLHWGGGPNTSVARTLVDHYTDPKKVEDLLSHGDMSSLGEEVGTEKNPWSNPDRKISVFYGRDRGDRVSPATSHKSEQDYADDVIDYDHAYLFKNGKWHHTRPQMNVRGPFRELSPKDPHTDSLRERAESLRSWSPKQTADL